MKYWMDIPIRLEIIQYRGSPLGQPRENTPRKMGIIHCIMFWLDCCLGSIDGVMDIFCWTQVDAATRTGNTKLVGSGSARFMPRNWLFSGAAWWMDTKVIHGYILSASPTRSSGLANRVWMSTRNRPIRMGI